MTPEQFTECTAAIHVEIEHALNKTIPMKVANLATKLFKFLRRYNLHYVKRKDSSLKSAYVSPAIGIELFKNNFMLLDTKMSYILPFSDNLHLRGFQFAAALNFVF